MMDSDKYLRKRGWEESRDGTWRNAGLAEFGWLHPDEAFKYQLQCDAEELDRLRDENRALATIVDALITVDLNGEKILAAIKDDLARGLDGNGHLGFVDLLIAARKAETNHAE